MLVEESSLANRDAIWFGVNNTGPNIRGPLGYFEEEVGARMHLTVDQVRELLPILKRFVKGGGVRS